MGYQDEKENAELQDLIAPEAGGGKLQREQEIATGGRHVRRHSRSASRVQLHLLALQQQQQLPQPPDVVPPSPGHLPTHSRQGSLALSHSRQGSLSPTLPSLSLTFSNFYDSQPFWLLLYFSFNLGLTLYNKSVLVHFPFPYTLTAIHALCGTIGGHLLLAQGAYVPAKLGYKENLALFGFSVLYAVNIAASNVSLQLVTVPFHQVVRASTPIFTIVLSYLFFNTICSQSKLLSLAPVIIGVGFATYGDYYFTTWGLTLTLFGTFLAALKTIFTNVLQSSPPSPSPSSPSPSSSSPKPTQPKTKAPLLHTLLPPRLHLNALDLLTRMSPLAFIQCVIYAQMSGELERVRVYSATEMSKGKAGALVANGLIAFGLNVVSFTANRKTGPLTMTVAANVKQVLTIALAMIIFSLPINAMNSVGIALTLLGGGWYAAVEYREKLGRAAAVVEVRP